MNNPFALAKEINPSNSINSNKDLLKKCLLIEYKFLENLCPLGMYIKLENNNIFHWDGILIIKDGLYQHSILNFKISIPDTYPTTCPSVTFSSTVYHPLIDPISGDLDINKLLPNWRAGKNSIIQIIYLLRDIFLNPVFFKITDSFNPDAGKAFNYNLDKFEEYVNDSIDIENERFNDNQDEDDDLNNNKKTIIEHFNNILRNKDLSVEQKKKNIKEWFLNTYVKNIHNK